LALNKCVNELTESKCFPARRLNDRISEIFIRETEWAAQCVLNQILGEATGEVLFAVGDKVA